jgi:hypothetical protein
MKSNQILDAAIHEIYGMQPRSVDAILCSPPLAVQFAEKVRLQMGNPRVPVESILRRAMTLRKAGEKKGGLPRKTH